MPFPYELYPKAKETHCLNLPEISVSRPPFPGSIRTADGCFWGERNNNSYVSTHKTDKVCTADGKCYNYNDVFVDEVDPGYSNTCGQTCYVACSCNTSNGWYSSCQGSDCFSVTDTRYAGQPNAASASRSLSDVTSISASGANSGISASAAANSGLKTASAAGNYTATAASAAAAATGAKSGISTLAAAATTCYKKKTCSEGGYYDSVPAGKKCPEVAYNGYTCYDTNCTNACPDGYFDTRPTLDATQSKYMEIHENNDGCFTIWCKSPATSSACATAPGPIEKCGKVLASYDNIKCYEGVGFFEIVVTETEDADPFWSYELYTNGGDVGTWTVTATLSGYCHIRGSYNDNISDCPSGEFDYTRQPFTSKQSSWSNGTWTGGEFVDMPENYEILGTMPKCIDIFGYAELISMSDVTINAKSNNPNVEVVTRIGW